VKPLESGITIDQARRLIAAEFRNAGIESPELDARILVGHALGLDHAALISNGPRTLDEASAAKVTTAVSRRLAGEPVSRILGTREFWGMSFAVTPAVLDPRADTETIVELALAVIDRHGPRTRPLRVADLGTGSGAILLALLSELQNAHGTGTDISRDALAVARRNAQALGLDTRADFVASDYGKALRGPFDLVVSNPPYIASGEIAGLAREVRDHDPLGALDGGPDGLTAYRAIAAEAPRLLVPGGHLVVEIGAGQQADVERLFVAAGLEIAATRHDLSGIPRAVAAKRPYQ
jgi:release factor glutamine methyltransferase